MRDYISMLKPDCPETNSEKTTNLFALAIDECSHLWEATHAIKRLWSVAGGLPFWLIVSHRRHHDLMRSNTLTVRCSCWIRTAKYLKCHHRPIWRIASAGKRAQDDARILEHQA